MAVLPHSVEHSVHVRTDRRGLGIGRHLVTELMSRATAMQKHVMIAGIDAENAASIKLHQSLGFIKVGIFMKWDSNSAVGSTGVPAMSPSSYKSVHNCKTDAINSKRPLLVAQS